MGGLHASIEQALRVLQVADLQGAAALVLVLAQLCGGPRQAFVALDTNHNGKISMSEFDSNLRLDFCLDYEAFTGMKLRTLFKEIDTERRGVITQQDFAECHPEIWDKYGRAMLETDPPRNTQSTPKNSEFKTY